MSHYTRKHFAQADFIPWDEVEPRPHPMIVFMVVLFSQMFTAAGVGFTFLAYNWLQAGYGLNPFISIPCAMVCFILPHTYRHL